MLIKCPECQKEISDKALVCPNCGYPINSEEIDENNIQNSLRSPVLPTDLAIGKQLVNWSGNAVVKGDYENSGNSNDKISNGKVSLMLFDNGIRLCGKLYMKILDIHYSQVISVEELKGTQLKDKSSIQRAIVGGVVFGPLGAIVGSVSGVGAKNAKTYYLIINYWDVNTRNPFAISISCSTSSKHFIDRLYKEKNNLVSLDNKFLHNETKTGTTVIIKSSNEDYKYLGWEVLFDYYKVCGSYSKAEDILYNRLETIDEYDVEKYKNAINEGIKFYEDLLNNNDDNLNKGNLPRNEVYDGLNELKKKLI